MHYKYFRTPKRRGFEFSFDLQQMDEAFRFNRFTLTQARNFLKSALEFAKPYADSSSHDWHEICEVENLLPLDVPTHDANQTIPIRYLLARHDGARLNGLLEEAMQLLKADGLAAKVRSAN